jgi:2-(1,2-epoxy-1,2-dihydrophenyl)acetyl-CoA isomerase
MKKNLHAAETHPLGLVCELEAIHQARLGLSEDHQEAVAAFGEKRRPVFRGR